MVTKQNKNNYKIYVQVLQNGEILSEIEKPFYKKGIIKLSSSPTAELTAPFYPLAHDMDLIKITKRGAELELPPSWDGYTTSYGKLETISSERKLPYTHIMKIGDYGSLSLNDLQVLIRIGLEKKTNRKSVSIDPNYRGKVSSLIWPSSSELTAFLSSFLVSTFLFLCLIIGLLMRSPKSTHDFLSLDKIYVLPFIHPDHLLHHPEALQDNLDRFRPIVSTMAFVKAFTAIISGFPIDQTNKSYLFPSTIENYTNLFQKNSKQIKNIKEDQLNLEQHLLKDSTYSLVEIPSVIGESINGNILRIRDKFSLIHENYLTSYHNRKKFNHEFNNDAIYEYGKYKNLSKRNFTGKTSKINLFSLLTNEEAMYQVASDLSNEARYYRNQIQKSRTPTTPLTIRNASPIGISKKNPYISFVNSIRSNQYNHKLSAINASSYHTHSSEIREPLIGKIDPTLIERTVRKNKFQLQLCFELALRKNPKVKGSMDWQWVLDSNGKILDIELIKSSIDDRQMINCVKRKIIQWKFPKPTRGSIAIRYPLYFESAKI